MVDSGHNGSDLLPEVSDTAGERIVQQQKAFREFIDVVLLSKARKRLLRRKRQFKKIAESAIQVWDRSCREVLAIDEKLVAAKETVQELEERTAERICISKISRKEEISKSIAFAVKIRT